MDAAAITTRTSSPLRISANHGLTKRLGRWTTEPSFEVRAHRGHVVLDLRSPHISPGDIKVHLDLDHAMLKLLVPDDAIVDDWDARRVGRGRVKDVHACASAGTGRRIVLTGQLRKGEVRIHRGAIAMLSAMFSREYLADLRRVHREGGFPTVDDPTRTA